MSGRRTYVALIRGVNVGGRSGLSMADLAAVLEDLGHRDVTTYLRSGNAAFTSGGADAGAIGAELAGRLAVLLGTPPAVMVRTAGDLRAVVDANPFVSEAAADPRTVHAAFLSAVPPDPSGLLDGAAAHAPERLAVGDRVLYLHLPGGIGRSKLAAHVGRRLGEGEMTVRNWRTVTKLDELARQLGGETGGDAPPAH